MYREERSDVAGVICTWERLAPHPATTLVVPDGCVDLVRWPDGRIEIAGPDTEPWTATLSAGTQVVGVRLAAGVARGVLGRPLPEFRDQRVRVEDVSGLAALGELAPDGRAALAALARRRRDGPDHLVLAAIEQIRRRPRLRVPELAAELGVSERQLRRRFSEHVGYGPKMFARVARLQRFGRVVRRPLTLADAALAAGYAGQSHLSDEVRALTGLTPVRFLEDWL